MKPRKQAQAQAQARRKAIIAEARANVEHINRLERKWKQRRQRVPLTAEEFSNAFKKYLPPELQAPAAAFLLNMFANAQQAKKAGRGRPPSESAPMIFPGPLIAEWLALVLVYIRL